MVKKKGCICWPTIRRTGSKSSGRTCQQTRCDDEEAKKEDGGLTGESATDLPPSIPAEHDNFLEMLFPSTGRQRSRTLSLSISHHQTDKRMLHRRHDNQTCATTLAGFRDRTHSSLSFAGRRMGPPMGLPPMGPLMGPPMGNDLLLLDMVPTTPDYTYSTRRTGAFTAATFPLGLRGGGGGGEERTDGGWPGYMGRQRRRGLDQKKLQQQERCQCSGCSDDNCSSLFKFPASPAEDDDDDDEDDEQEEEEEEEETVEHQFGPFFDNESYYNRQQQQQQQGGCWRREQRKVSAGYDQPTICFHQMYGRGVRLYDVPRSTKHRPVFCSKDSSERICPRHHQEAAARYPDDQDQIDARYQDDGDQHEARCRRGELVEDYAGQLGIPRQRQETRRRQSASKMADDDDDDGICDVDGATSKAAAVAPDVQGSHYARPIEWRRKTGGRKVRQQQQQEVLVCRRCFVCQLKLEEEGCGRATGSYHRMSAIPSPRTNTLRRCNGEESSYVLSDRLSASDFGKAFDYIVPSQRIGGAKERDGKGADGRNGEKLPADGGYLTPLSARNEKLTRDNKMNLPKEMVEEAKRESPLLSMRQFLKETQRGTETEKKEEFIEKKKKKKRYDSTHPRDDNIQAAKATNKVDSDDHQPSPSFLRETDLGSEDGIRQDDWAEAPSSSDPLSSTTEAVGSGLQQSPEEPQEREDAGGPGLGSNCRGNPDEGVLGKEELSQRKLQSIAMDSVKSKNEDEGRKFKDIVVKGSCLSEVEEKEDQEAGAAGLQVVPSDSVSQLDLLLMCPPPQCFQMVNFSYMNVNGQSKAKATACSSNGGAAVVVHRDHKCVVDERPDSSCSSSCSDIQRLQATNERSNGFHCGEMKPTSCKRQLKTEIDEDGKEEEEEKNVGLCQRPSVSPLARLFKNTPSELDFYYNPYLPSMEESLRSTCLAN